MRFVAAGAAGSLLMRFSAFLASPVHVAAINPTCFKHVFETSPNCCSIVVTSFADLKISVPLATNYASGSVLLNFWVALKTCEKQELSDTLTALAFD